MRLLITNDDGISAPGIQTLTRAISRWVAVNPAERSAIVVAPATNQSGMSSAVGDVFEKPSVHYKKVTISGADNIPAYALEATPALCTIIGALGSFGERPTMVVSGINAGANVGRSVLHSGTIGAILTGSQLGLSGLAVSVQWGDNVHYDTAANVAVEVLDQFFTAPERTLLNLNVPNLAPDELQGVRRGRIRQPASSSQPGAVSTAWSLAKKVRCLFGSVRRRPISVTSPTKSLTMTAH